MSMAGATKPELRSGPHGDRRQVTAQILGFVLPALVRPSIPAPALHVALMHGLALDEVEVAWPGAPER